MMEDKSKGMAIGGLRVAVGLVLLGLCIKSAIDGFKDKERVVSVKGLAEMEVKANHVIWPLMFKNIGNDLPALYVTMENQIKDLLSTNGIDSTEVSAAAPEIIDMKAERYTNENVAYRYNVTCVLTVSSSKVDLVRGLMIRQSDLLKQGIAITGGDYRFSTQFLFTGLNDIKPQMIEEATKNARASAEKFAADSDSELGKIRTANQGQFTISDRDANTPDIKSVRVVTTVDYYLND